MRPSQTVILSKNYESCTNIKMSYFHNSKTVKMVNQKHDNQYSTEKAENVYNVTWSDVTHVKWPAPPKACTKCCAKSAKKPY